MGFLSLSLTFGDLVFKAFPVFSVGYKIMKEVSDSRQEMPVKPSEAKGSRLSKPRTHILHVSYGFESEKDLQAEYAPSIHSLRQKGLGACLRSFHCLLATSWSKLRTCLLSHFHPLFLLHP